MTDKEKIKEEVKRVSEYWDIYGYDKELAEIIIEQRSKTAKTFRKSFIKTIDELTAFGEQQEFIYKASPTVKATYSGWCAGLEELKRRLDDVAPKASTSELKRDEK